MPEDIVKRLDEKVMGVLGDINQDIRVAVDELEKQKEINYAARRQEQAALQAMRESEVRGKAGSFPGVVMPSNPDPHPPSPSKEWYKERTMESSTISDAELDQNVLAKLSIPTQNLAIMQKTFASAKNESELREMMKLFLEEYRRMNKLGK